MHALHALFETPQGRGELLALLVSQILDEAEVMLAVFLVVVVVVVVIVVAVGDFAAC